MHLSCFLNSTQMSCLLSSSSTITLDQSSISSSTLHSLSVIIERRCCVDLNGETEGHVRGGRTDLDMHRGISIYHLCDPGQASATR